VHVLVYSLIYSPTVEFLSQSSDEVTMGLENELLYSKREEGGYG